MQPMKNSKFWVADHGLRVLFCLLFCFVAVRGQTSQAAPVVVPSARLTPFWEVPVAQLVAYTVQPKISPPLPAASAAIPASAAKFVATRIALQVQELNSRDTLEFEGHSSRVEGHTLKQQPQSESAARTRFSRFHRLVLSERDFAPCDQECLSAAKQLLKAECPHFNKNGASQVVQVTLKWRSAVAFVLDCGQPVLPWGAQPAVRVSLDKRTLESSKLRYTYSQKNHMLLQDFALNKGEQGEKFVSLLAESEMHLYAKPRYFFPLHFTGDDVRSEVSRVQVAPLSSAGQLTFFLDVLSFKISLNLLSEVSMFEDAIHVPVLLNLPVSGSMLRVGSGIYYGFKFAKGMNMSSVKTDMPRLPAGNSRIPFAPTRTFQVQSPDFSVAVGVHMPPAFEAMGFAPALALPEDLKKRGFPKVGSDFGIFYDITQLKKGTHRFDLWFYVGHSGDEERVKTFARDGVEFSLEPLLL